MVMIPVVPFENVIFAYNNAKLSLANEPSGNCAKKRPVIQKGNVVPWGQIEPPTVTKMKRALTKRKPIVYLFII